MTRVGPVASLGLALLLSGCVAPARGAQGYAAGAHRALDSAVSEVGTARIAVETLLAHRILRTTADEIVSDSEAALSGLADSFTAVQPPRESDEVHDRASKVLSDASDAVERARIAVRRGDDGATRQALDRLRDSLTALDKAAGGLA